MRTRKQEKKEKRRKTRFAKGTKERKQRDSQKYAPKKKIVMKKEEKKNQTKNGWPGRTERGALPVTSHMFFVAICLLRFPTCTVALPII